jgi:ATP adenylyltransferase/5',5'''-P-1,P-4-tetraphosphate phosphorylase II
MMVYSESVNDLFYSQLSDWELARVNYALLSKVKTREVGFKGFRILVQFNPERIRSSVAKTDTKSIEARPCFLCSKNRPSEQRGVSFGKDMTLLVNPFPIFTRHLTIPSELHVDQRILHNFPSMLTLAEAIPDFVIFYNGPQCGASAPDHFHFQAGNKGFLPVETDFTEGRFTRLLSKAPGVEVWHWTGYLRGMMTLKGTDKEKLTQAFNKFYNKFSDFQPDKPEPMLNILAYYYADSWIIHIIPRKIHRPKQFFAEGDKQILLSPASVDLGGVIILPREEDYLKITAPDITDIFDQVCISDKEIAGFFSNII